MIIGGTTDLGWGNVEQEVWFAMPFESIIDVNGLRNSAVIPPGHMKFVTARSKFTTEIGGVRIENVAMLEDITFPDPYNNYGSSDCDGDGEEEGTCVLGEQTNRALSYRTQTFEFGDMLTISGSLGGGVRVVSETSFGADSTGISVKGHSDASSVDRDQQEAPVQRFSISGLNFGGIRLNERISPKLSGSTEFDL